ncbi:hypothetical protein TNCV_2770681 [Trichonephila clavipes]|nr:hypothetical protein TNCV_2770681 [Trichonephila clavipes]
MSSDGTRHLVIARFESTRHEIFLTAVSFIPPRSLTAFDFISQKLSSGINGTTIHKIIIHRSRGASVAQWSRYQIIAGMS